MDERFLKEDGSEIYTGNELVLKGALESATALITGYPGSPVSEIFDTAYRNRELLKKKGILAEMANNEALAVARLNGSRMAGVRAMAVMKSVGLHVAADGLALGNLSEPNNAGGSLVVVGDDPWIDSTQINNDSRFLSQHLHMPVIEPATFQEIKDWVELGFQLSSAANLYMTYLVTTHQADGGGTVWVRPNRYPNVSTLNPTTIRTESIDLDRNVLLPPRTWHREASLPDRFSVLFAEARSRRLNRIVWPAGFSRAPFGFVASGLAYCYLEHALSELDLSGRFPILKLGLSYPVDPKAVLALAAYVDSIYVIEEKRGFIETQVIEILQKAFQSGELVTPLPVWGKAFPSGLSGIPEMRGLNSSIVLERVAPLFLGENSGLLDSERARVRSEQALVEATAAATVTVPSRTPTFCPGCPHRDSSSVFLEIKKDFANPVYMRRQHKRDALDLVFHGETGCFTMLMFEPNKALMHNYSGMGIGGGTGAGLDPFVTNKQIVFLGDSTFFHSGMVAISDSIKNGQDILYVILDNKTTAMTGNQPTPGTPTNLMGERTDVQKIEEILKGMTAGQKNPVVRVNPEARDEYRQLLEEMILENGVKVVIADKECGLTYHRRARHERLQAKRTQGFLKEERFINVSPDVCEFCLECTSNTGCPGLTIETTAYGPKITTDLSSCVSDGACTKVKACPAFEEVIVTRRAPAKRMPLVPSFSNLPVPSVAPIENEWYGYVAAVGGQGAGFVSELLLRAAQRDGLRTLFADKKGLAIRNGGVYSHLVFSRRGGTLAPLVPYGKADLLLGLDLLEAARALAPNVPMRVAHAGRTNAVVNAAVSPSVLMLLGRDQSQPAQWEQMLRAHSRAESFWTGDVSAVSEFFLGSKLYANVILLGAACQRGVLPVALDSLESALAKASPHGESAVNATAFRLGRALVACPSEVPMPVPLDTYDSLLAEKRARLESRHGPKMAASYAGLIQEAVEAFRSDETLHRQLALRAYDLIDYDGLPSAHRYVSLVLATLRKDRREFGLKATRAVLENAFKVIAIKDEVYVAHLLTRAEKYERDRRRYGIDEANGDQVTYRHFNRPEIPFFGKTIRWNMRTRDWQLRLVRHLRFLRRWWPGWHRQEQEFRDWYLSLVERFDAVNESEYDVWVEILESPRAIRGFREVRQPSMDAAWNRVQRLVYELSERPASVQSKP